MKNEAYAHSWPLQLVPFQAASESNETYVNKPLQTSMATLGPEYSECCRSDENTRSVQKPR